MKIFLNSIKQLSLCDGYGCRTVVFLQGCDIHCPGCHNSSTWDIKKGTEIEISDLVREIRQKSFNKKLTISGGEPLLQKDALIELLKELKDFDLCLYTGHELKDVPKDVMKYLKYLKVGRFISEEKTTIQPFIGSKNQKFITL